MLNNVDSLIGTVARGTRYRHRKGSTYTALGTAKVQTDTPLADYAEVVVYQSQDAERSIWVRPVGEFTDGRFTPIEASSTPPTDAELAEQYRDRAEGLSADLDGAVEKLWEVGGEEGREWVGWNYAKTAERLRGETDAARDTTEAQADALRAHPLDAHPLDASDIEVAARRVVGAASTTFRKRNGQIGTLEGDDGEMSYIVSFDDMEQLRAALFSASPAATTEAVFAQIVEYAVAIAFQAGVGSSETAGVIVSFLARRPELLAAFMRGELSATDSGMLDHHNGVLTWHGADGNVHGPDPSKARFPAGRQVGPIAFDLSTFTTDATQKGERSR